MQESKTGAWSEVLKSEKMHKIIKVGNEERNKVLSEPKG